MPFPCVIGRGGARQTRRVLRLLAVDGGPPDWRPSGAGLARGTRGGCSRFTPSRGTPHRGGAAADARSHGRETTGRAGNGRRRSRQRSLPGDGSHDGEHFPSPGHHHLLGVCAAGASRAVAWAQPPRCLPTASLERWREFFATAVERAAHLGRIAGGPRAVKQRPAGMGVSRGGDRALPPPRPPGVCCGGQAAGTPALSGVVNARQRTQLGDEGDGHGAWHPPQRWQGLDHRRKAPGLRRLVACVCATGPAVSGLVHGPESFWADEWRHRGRTDHRRAPAPGGWPPGGPAGVAAIVPPQTRVETAWGGLESLDGSCAGPAQRADGLVFDLGPRDGRPGPRAPQAGPLHGVTASGCEPVASLVGKPRGGHDPAHVALLRQIARAPIAARTGRVHQDQGLAFRRQRTAEVLAGAWSSPHGTQEHAIGGLVVGTIGHRERVVMDSQADGARARRGQGGPPRLEWCRCRPEAALAACPRPRGATGGQPPHRKS